jgi:ribose/xylose/arabinose/galactoside ABC-type transport system permease subunit
MNKLGKTTLLGALDNIIWPILVIVYVGFAYLKPSAMLNWDMAVYIVYSAIPLGFLVLAEAIVLLNGRFDLSVERIAGLSAAVGAVICKKGLEPVLLTPFVPIVIGALCGSLNAFFVGRMGLNAFLVTLGTYFVFYGAQLLVQYEVIYKLPKLYLFPGESRLFSILAFVTILIFFDFIFHQTKFGNHYLAVGSTPRAAAMMGLSTPLFTMYAFILSGTLSGIAGLFYTGYIGAYGPLLATNAVFMAFAAAVLGGISLKGGRGRIVNIFGGIILLSTIGSGLTVICINPYVQRVIIGSLVVVAVIIDLLRMRVRESIMREA